MRLLAALMVTTAWSYGFAQETPIQSSISITKSQGNTDLKCHFKDFSGNFDNTVIHWYQQKENEAPVRMIYFSSGTVEVDESFQRHRVVTRLFLENESEKGKFSMEKDLDKSERTLTVGRVTLQDAATYYCARWDAQQQTAIGNLHKDTLCSSTRP
ncbi:hypothetical protein ASZ78_016834 [Callipepla squamata]|uniref:Ig-like domain-containing protein n=1 Tax=Callipepla squamata TaxID=9009 RepID=A0A226M9P5_CALSU|nr:hypothetical protein ASZ78_016834 [Callipepla squamata]